MLVLATSTSLIYYRKELGFENENDVLAILVTAILAVGGYVYQSIENSQQASARLLQEKNLLLWQDQKNLSFAFITFLDRRFFFNPKIQNGNPASAEYKNETQDFFNKLNTYYGKLYLVLNTELIEKINNTIIGYTSQVQRYYLLREIRLQMRQYISDKKITEFDAPYIPWKISDVTVPVGSQKPTNFEELHKIYPFVEKASGTEDTFKSLPVFSENKH